MPLINVKLIEDVFTPDQKREIVERLTDAMVSIEGENMRSVTWVVVEEVASGDGGMAASRCAAKTSRHSRPARRPSFPAASHGRGARRRRTPRPMLAVFAEIGVGSSGERWRVGT
jgi:4-oxalocrotonate tautomerase